METRHTLEEVMDGTVAADLMRPVEEPLGGGVRVEAATEAARATSDSMCTCTAVLCCVRK